MPNPFSTLFTYDNRTLQTSLLPRPQSRPGRGRSAAGSPSDLEKPSYALARTVPSSEVEYDEYVVYRPRQGANLSDDSLRERIGRGDGRLAHWVRGRDGNGNGYGHERGSPGAEMLDLAFRRGYIVDSDGSFTHPGVEDPAQDRMEGRIRRVTCYRTSTSSDPVTEGLSITADDLAVLNLHPSTLSYTQRALTSASFWSKDQTQLSLILSFPAHPRAPYDFLSTTCNLRDRCTTILVRQNHSPRGAHSHAPPSRSAEDQSIPHPPFDPHLPAQEPHPDDDEYDARLSSCQAQWSHPLVVPAVLLQVQYARTEEALCANDADITDLEASVAHTLNLPRAAQSTDLLPPIRPRTSRRNAPGNAGVAPPTGLPELVRAAHAYQREAAALLDSIRWMEKVAKLLMRTGDDVVRLQGGERDGDWHEIWQYLNALLHLCESLETGRRVADGRCRALIDIISTKLAQEQTLHTARTATASETDTPSTKTLTFLLALFLPSLYVSSLLSTSFFNFMAPPTSNAPSSLGDAGVVSSRFYIYWATTLPLTLAIFLLWRTWWVLHTYRNEPSSRPSFIRSFFGQRASHPSPRRFGPIANANPVAAATPSPTTAAKMSYYVPAPPYRPGQREVESRYEGLAEGPGSPKEGVAYSRQRQILFARGENMRLRQPSGGV